MDNVEWLLEEDALVKTEELEIIDGDDPLNDQIEEQKQILELSMQEWNGKSVPSNNKHATPSQKPEQSRGEQLQHLFKTLMKPGADRKFLRDSGDWIKLTQELNAMGPPVRSMQKWKKIWADKKCYMFKKSQQLMQKPQPAVKTQQLTAKTLISSLNSASKPSPVLRKPQVTAETLRVPTEVEQDPTESKHPSTSKDTLREPSNFELGPGHNMRPFEKSVVELLTDLREEKRRQNAMLEQQLKHQRDLVKIKIEKLKLYRESVERKRKEHNRKWNISSWRVEENTDFKSD